MPWLPAHPDSYLARASIAQVSPCYQLQVKAFCCAANRMRNRIASRKNVTGPLGVASSKMFLLPHRLSARPEAPVSTYLMQISCCCGPCGVVGDALASSKHSGKSTGLFAPPSRSLGELFVPLPSRPRSMSRAGSAVVVPNTIRCAASRRHSFRRRCSVRRRPSG